MTTILVTDSGLGGLSVFADIASQLRKKAPVEKIKLVYFNAWPFPDKGYNHFPDMAAKAIVFNNALETMATYAPDTILVACNTLSVIYPFTNFSRTTNSLVTGIVDHGVSLLFEHLNHTPDSRVVIFGTPTTTGEETHKKALVKMGISPERIINQGCVNLAGKIERNPFGKEVAQMIAANAKQAASKLGPVKETVFAALCCTHFGYCSDLFSTCLARHAGQKVVSLNPNTRMGQLDQIFPMDNIKMENIQTADGKKAVPQFFSPKIEMEIVSRVEWEKTRIRAYERLLYKVSPQTVGALKQYTWNKDLFRVD
jgi:glutamate racemase